MFNANMTAAPDMLKNDKNSNEESSADCYFCKDPLEDTKTTGSWECPD